MIKIKLIEGDRKNILVTQNGQTIVRPACFLADTNVFGNVVIVSMDSAIQHIEREGVSPTNIMVGETVYATASEAVRALNAFIGNFRRAGGSAETTLSGFEANKPYNAGTAIVENGSVWVATADFMSGASFDADDWERAGVSLDELDGKLDEAASTDTYESRFFHDDNGEGGHKVSAPGFAVIAALSRTVSSAVQRVVYVINSLNGYGTRLMHTMSKIYYTKDADGEAFTDADELATKGDINRYSTDEMKVGTWIDGKPIYKKTFKIKSPKLVSSTVATDYDTGIFIDVPIRSETVFYHTDPTVNSGNVYYNSALQLRYVAGQYKSNASGNETLRVYVVLPYATSSSAFSECDVYITSYYTKS